MELSWDQLTASDSQPSALDDPVLVAAKDLRDQRCLDKTRDGLARTDLVRRRPDFEDTITVNWGCGAGAILPVLLWPQVRLGNGKRVGHEKLSKARLPMAEWTKTFKSALLKLSLLTLHDAAFAHQKLGEQVRRRHVSRKHPEHYAKELLSSDIDMVIKEVTTLARSGRYGSRQLAQKVDHLSAKDAIVPDEAWEEHHTNSSALPREKAVDPANQASEAREDDESWTKEDQEMYKMVLAERKGEKV